MSKSKPKSTRKTKTVKKRTSSTANNKVTTTKKTKRTKTSVPGNRPHEEATVTLERELRKYCNKPQNNITYEYLISKGNNFHGEDWGGAGIRNKIPSLRRFTPGQLNNSLRTLRKNAAAAAPKATSTAPKNKKQKMSKAKSTTTAAAKAANKKSKYINKRVHKSFGRKGTHNGTVEYDKKTKRLVVQYDDGEDAEYENEDDMIADGHKMGETKKKRKKPPTKSSKKKSAAAAVSTSTTKSTASTRKPRRKRGSTAVEKEAVDTSNKRATRSSNRIKQQQKSNTAEIEENNDEGSGNNEKGEDEQPPTNKGGDKVADKENDTLDTNKDKEEGSPSKESDLVDDSSGDKDDHQHDLQFSDNEGGGGGGGDMLMQSPAKSVNSTRSEITTTMSTDITSMLEDIIQRAMSKLDRRAVHLLGQAMAKVSTNITTPLQDEITDMEDEIANSKQLIEVQTSLQSQASKNLATGIELGININDIDKIKEKNTRILEGKENEKAEKVAKLQTINNNRPAIRKLLSNIITSCFTIRSGSYKLQPSFDNNTDGIESYVIDESTSGIGQIASELETECEDFVNLLMSVYVEKLEKEKTEYLDELQDDDEDILHYDSLQESYNKLCHSYKAAKENKRHFRSQRLDFEGGAAAYEKQFPGQVDYWINMAIDTKSRRDTAKKKRDDVYEQVLAYRAENDIKLRDMLTIKIGSVDIQPPLELG